MEHGSDRRLLSLIVELILAAVLLLAVFFRFISSDRTGPIINIPDHETVLTGSMTETQLLNGVTAEDSRDGDVSDSLRLESVTETAENRIVLVYAAKDKRNNVSKVSRTLMSDGTFTYGDMVKGESSGMEPAENDNSGSQTASEESGHVSDTDSLSVQAAASDLEPSERESSEERTESVDFVYDSELSTEDTYSLQQFVDPSREPTSFTEMEIEKLNERLRNANNISISRLPDGFPVLRISRYAMIKTSSEEFSALSYVSDVRDDTDSAEDILSGISVTGNDSLDQTGIHTVSYYATDSDGNRSNVAHMIVVVTD